MLRSILLTVLALGAQAAWAQDATDPTGDDVVVEETSESVRQMTDDGDKTDVMDETEVVEDETGAVDDEAEFVEDETGAVDDETEISEESEAVRTDNRSARGAFRGGHHGQVSTLARAGLGPVFGKLRSQGYGDIAIEQVGNEITISAARAGETRQLVYDASTGALLSDAAEPSAAAILNGFSNKLKKQSTVSSKRDGRASEEADVGSKDRDHGKGGASGKRSSKGDDNGIGTEEGGDNGKSNGQGGSSGKGSSKGSDNGKSSSKGGDNGKSSGKGGDNGKSSSKGGNKGKSSGNTSASSG